VRTVGRGSEHVSAIRFKRLAADLHFRRRRLNAYQRPNTWPGKERAWRSELIFYDRYLVIAAEMLEVPAPELPAHAPLSPELRAALEDRLAMAGLDVYAPKDGVTGDIVDDGDLCL
jgi:hypothetical protein